MSAPGTPMQDAPWIGGRVPGLPGAVIVAVPALPDRLDGAENIDPFAWIKPGETLLVVPGAGRFLASGGKTIAVASDADTDPGYLRLILHGSARGALIYQRGDIPLHAATLVRPGDDAAIAICGPSGAGKSTLAAELTRRGWLLVADDTTRIVAGPEGAIAWPSRDTIKLWRDACEALGIEVGGLEAVSVRLDKYYLRVPSLATPMRLSTIFELAPSCPQRVRIDDAVGRMATLTRHTYRQAYVRPSGMAAKYVRGIADIARACRIFQLPGERRMTPGALADLIDETHRP